MSEEGRNKSLRYTKNTKLIPRDISDQLGKLPPQALDMEEVVIGAAILERDAFKRVSSFLKSDHFYTEVHKEIWTAINDLVTTGEKVDMRMVVMQLRRAGKLEMIGGMAYIAELTSKVSSSENIESHARIIVEMAIKRELIQFASRIHHSAYEDDVNVFSFLESTYTGILDIRTTSVIGNGPERMKDIWQRTLIQEEPPEVPPIITIDGSPVATPGNHSLIVGRKKSRKTLYIIWLAAKAIKEKRIQPEEVAIFDTEQGKRHVWKVRDKLQKMTGNPSAVFYLRGMSAAQRKEFIENTIEHWAVKFKFIVIDGIRDLIININDPDESAALIEWIEMLILKHDIHIMNVLHLNKTDGNARGHIGSELLNKAESTTELEIDESTGATIVKCESSRERPFETFAFTHGLDDLPEIIGVPVAKEIMPEKEELNRLQVIFADGSLRYKEALELIKQHFSVGASKGGQLLMKFVRANWVVKSGKAHAKETMYKLVVAADGKVEAPVVEPDNQQSLFEQPTNGVHHDEPAEVNIDDLPF